MNGFPAIGREYVRVSVEKPYEEDCFSNEVEIQRAESYNEGQSCRSVSCYAAFIVEIIVILRGTEVAKRCAQI